MVVTVPDEVASFVVFEGVYGELQLAGFLDLLLLRIRVEVRRTDPDQLSECWQRVGDEVWVQEPVLFVDRFVETYQNTFLCDDLELLIF